MTAYYHNLIEEELKKDVIKTVMKMVDGDETTLSILQQEIRTLTPDFTETIIPIKKYICRGDFTFSEHNCCARVWNEGYGGQCTNKKKNSSLICGKHQNMIDKLKIILENYSSLSEKMANPDIISNVTEYAKLAKEHRQMSETVSLAKEYIKTHNQIEDDEEILNGEDSELKELVKEASDEQENLKQDESIKVFITEDSETPISNLSQFNSKDSREEIQKFIKAETKEHFMDNFKKTVKTEQKRVKENPIERDEHGALVLPDDEKT